MPEDLDQGRIDILLIEDELTTVVSTAKALKKATICNRVHTLGEGSDAVDFLLGQGQFAGQPRLAIQTVILLALNLGKVSGLDVLRKIKSDERTKSFPVILLTSSQEDRGVMQGYKLGASACIVKPLDLHKLVEAVSELKLGWLLVSSEENR